jgi:hypothetical protein
MKTKKLLLSTYLSFLIIVINQTFVLSSDRGKALWYLLNEMNTGSDFVVRIALYVVYFLSYPPSIEYLT